MDFLSTLLNLLLLSFYFGYSFGGTVTTDPNRACVGDNITVSCTLDVSNTASDEFDSVRTDFIVGDSDIPISEAFVDATGTHGNVDLSKLLATANPGTRTSVEGTITLLSYSPQDNGIRLGCANEYFINGNTSDIANVSESTTILRAAVPSTPNNINTDISSLSSDCTNTLVSWTAPATTDRPIDRYYVSRNSSLLAVTTDTQYTDTDQLSVNTLYEYSVVANSCAGSSMGGVGNSIIIPDYMLDSITPISYDNTTFTVTVRWTLSSSSGVAALLLTYSLNLTYSHTQNNMTLYNNVITSFSQLSNDTTYSQIITVPSFTTNEPITTNVTACISITEQCGTPFIGATECGLYSSVTLGIVETPPPPPTTQPSSINASVIVAVVVAVAVVLTFGLMGLLAVFITIIIIKVCQKNKVPGYSKQGNLVKEEGGGENQKEGFEKEKQSEETHYTAGKEMMGRPHNTITTTTTLPRENEHPVI